MPARSTKMGGLGWKVGNRLEYFSKEDKQMTFSITNYQRNTNENNKTVPHFSNDGYF